ncbi:hypothetical protein BV898_12659 [Hypsibius exemplaris]|uniref:Fanconi-associated nuclease n=1 Tax=Hypsibius exemplaris TaxID=2072580 RepID=A0A1W0WD52_HYPEX|nr:hypothetical protein BV898_12659 [Hypsibius exemplaris]
MAEVFTAAIESGEEEEVERSSKNVEIVDESTVVPYYLESFRFIVRSISEDSSLNTLLFEDPLCEVVLQRFEKLQTSAQRLYVRLFLRKHVWLKREKIRYDKEFGDAAAVDGLLDELCRGSFLESHIPEMELEEILGMLSLPQMKELAKQFRIGVGNPSKKELLVLTLKKVREQRTPFGLPLGKIVKNAAVKLLGKVYRMGQKKC